jgi:hypothetical protein
LCAARSSLECGAHVRRGGRFSALTQTLLRRRYLLGHPARTPSAVMRAVLLDAAVAAGRPDLCAAIPPADTWEPAVPAGGAGGPEMDSGRAVRELRGGRALTAAADTVREMAAAMLRGA